MPFIEIEEEEKEFWLDCPNCNKKPYIWEFDNGRYARCECIDDYDQKNYISATNVRECYNNEGVQIKEYNVYELSENWNKHVKHSIRKNKIKIVLDNI